MADNTMESSVNVLFVSNDWDGKGGACMSLIDMISSVRNKIYPIVLLKYEGEVSRKMEELGIEFIICPFCDIIMDSNWKTYLKKYARVNYRYFHMNYICVHKVCDLLKNRKISIVHSNSSAMDIGKDLAKALHAKHVWHIREFLDIDYNHRVLNGRLWHRWKLNQADARIAISKSVKEHWNLRNEQTFIISNAVRSRKDAVLDLEKEKYVLFCAAYLLEKKGAFFTVEAFGQSGLSENGFKLVMVGAYSEENKEKLLAIAEQYKIKDKLILAGYSQNVKPFFQKAKLFVMASEHEALGRVTIEALFYGCLVAARSTGGSLEIIHDGENGFFFNNVAECAALMRKLCLKDNRDILIKAQSDAIDNYSIENYSKKILKVYESVL